LHLSAPKSERDVSLDLIVASEIGILFSKMVFLWFAEAFLETYAMNSVQAREGNCKTSIVSSLLKMMCDAVVDIDQDLKLKSDDPSLSHLLMHGSGKRLKGTNLLSFFEGNCREGGFESSVTSRELKPGSFVEWLRDAMGQRIKVQLYHMPYINICGSVHHLVGVREDSDGNTQSMFPVPEPAKGVMHKSNSNRDIETESLPEESVSSQSSVGSVPGDNTMVVDVRVVERLPITGATQRFWHLIGGEGSDDRCFADILNSDDAQALFLWLLNHSGPGQQQIQKFGKVRLLRTTPAGPAWGAWSAQVCFPPQDQGDFQVSIRLSRLRRGSTQGGTPAAVAATELGGSQVMHL